MNPEEFKCGICSLLVWYPVRLECGKNVCNKHLKILKKIHGASYICEICNKSHSFKNRTRAILPTLKFDPVLAIAEAKETVKRMSNTDPECLVYEYFEDIKRQVDLRREELKIQIDSDSYTMAETKMETDLRREEFKIKIDQYSEELIISITETQSECMESSKKVNETGMDENVKNKLNETIEKYEEMTISEEEFKKTMRHILRIKFQGDKMLEECNQSMLSEKYKFKYDLNSIKQFEVISNIDVSKYSQICNDFFGTFSISEKTEMFDSTIVPSSQYKLTELCGIATYQQWNLIYRGSSDGFSAEAFHKKCDGIKDTFTIIKSTHGNIFGGYTSQPWSSVSTFINDTTAFVFSLVNKQNDPFKRQNAVRGINAVKCSPFNGPCFGDGDICIASDSNANEDSYCNFGNSYIHRSYKYKPVTVRSILAGSNHFRVLEIEVFSKKFQ